MNQWINRPSFAPFRSLTSTHKPLSFPNPRLCNSPNSLVTQMYFEWLFDYLTPRWKQNYWTPVIKSLTLNPPALQLCNCPLQRIQALCLAVTLVGHWSHSNTLPIVNSAVKTTIQSRLHSEKCQLSSREKSETNNKIIDSNCCQALWWYSVQCWWVVTPKKPQTQRHDTDLWVSEWSHGV